MVHMMMEKNFDSLVSSEFSYSDKLKTRDFVHLYEFQKYFLYKSIRRLMGLVKLKQIHYWNEKRDASAWQKLGEYI